MSGSMPRIGLIVHRGRDALFNALVNNLAGRGYIDGQTIVLDPRFAEGVLDRTTGFAEDLVAQNVDLIIAIGFVGAQAARRATGRIPIVYSIVLDPVDAGFAAAVDRPRGNMAGVTNYDPDLAFKQFSLLKEVVPGLKRVAILSDIDIPRPGGWNSLERSNEVAARSLGLEPLWVRLKGPKPDGVAAFHEIAEVGAQALQVLEVPVTIADFQSIAAHAIERRLPAMFPGGWQHDGLLAYGTSLLQTLPEIPELVGLILNGADPGDIPVKWVREHRLRLNLATARKIGLDVPINVVARATEVIGIDG